MHAWALWSAGCLPCMTLSKLLAGPEPQLPMWGLGVNKHGIPGAWRDPLKGSVSPARSHPVGGRAVTEAQRGEDSLGRKGHRAPAWTF